MDPRRARLLRAMAVALLFLGTAGAVYSLSTTSLTAAEVSGWIVPHRNAWYALPMTMVGFVVLCLVPVLLLIAATGVAFGPWLGPLYAMAGCLASASFGFALGRWLGRRRVERWGGRRVRQIAPLLARNGTLAVFLVRKVPAPFLLVNVVVGASPVGYRDFVIGTTLGMGAIVVALAGFGYQLTEAWRHPSATTLLRASLFLAIPLTAAWLINRRLRGSRAGDDGRA
jgi:phospholipase D1/2